MEATTQPPAAALPSGAGSDRLDLRYLDGLRALAAIAVILRHGWLSIWLGGADTAPHWVPFLFNGHTVPVFVVLSGYCLMLPVVRGDGGLRGGLLAFYAKRARRILPPYYFAIGFALLLDYLWIGDAGGGFWAGTLPLTWHGLLVHLLLQQNFSLSQIHTINHVFWSLSLEWWFYLLFPALVLAWKRLGPAATTAGICAASAVAFGICRHTMHNGFSLHLGVPFALGMLGAEVAHTRRAAALAALRDRLPWGALTGFAGGLLLLSLSGRVRHFSTNEMADLLVGLTAACLLVTLGTRTGTLAHRVLSCRPLVFVGTFAYSVYLVHAPLVQMLWQFVLVPLHLTPLAGFLLLAAAGIPAILAASYIFHLACERPFATRLLPGASPSAPLLQIFLGALGNRLAFRDVPFVTRTAGGTQISQAAEKEVFYERSGLGLYRRIR